MNRYLFLFICLLGVSGCGSSDRDPYFRAPTVPAPPAARTATVELRSILAQTPVPSYVTTVRGSGLAASGERIYGPEEQALAATIRWTGVPVETRTFLFEFLGSNGRVLGNATVPVQLTESETFVVNDLTVAFAPDPNPDPTPEPTPEPEPDLRLETDQSYQFNTDTGVISPPIEGSSNPTGWNSETKEFELNSFTLEPGAVLNVTGNTALALKVQGDVVVDGTLSFVGADGAAGEDTEVATTTLMRAVSVNAQATALDLTGAAGVNGADGGVRVTASGQISGSGTIISNGGNGGQGGSIKFNAANTTITSVVTGGRGGNGGAPGSVTLQGAPGSVLVSLTIQTAAGHGGDGGSIELAGEGCLVDEGGELYGGRGGDASGQGGIAGDGGDVTFSAEYGTNTTTVVGGAGGTGAFQGGVGGDVTFAEFNGRNIGTITGGAGGASDNYGGQGGSVQFSGQYATNESQGSLRGGDGGSGGLQGGNGGGVVLSGETSSSYGLTRGGKGGNGGTVGGNGGTVDFSGRYGFNNTNATATGGEGGSGGLAGGDGGDVHFSVRNQGTAIGGAGGNATQPAGAGGAGGDVVFEAGAAANGTKTGGAGGNPGGSAGTVIGP